MKRTSNVIWKGSGKEGSGIITSQSGAISHAPYTWGSRFEEQQGTNPEELIAAAHAACFTMHLSFNIGKAGFVPEVIDTTAEVTLANNAISHSHLTVKAKIPGMSEKMFEELAKDSKENCPVSKALNMKITVDATLSEMVDANSDYFF